MNNYFQRTVHTTRDRDVSEIRRAYNRGFFVNDTNLTFLTFLYKISIDVFKKIKLPPVGIELTTDHHWFTSLMPIKLC